MKIFTNKFDDSFYLPITNNSSRDELPYSVIVDDGYGILSIENTVGPVSNNIYITVPKVPSIPIQQDTFYAKAKELTPTSIQYHLEIESPNQVFNAYENGKEFFLFLTDGSYSNIRVQYMGYSGQFPMFLIDEGSLKKLLGPGQQLPTPSTPVLLPFPYSISTEFETRNFLKVSTSTTAFGRQTATVTLLNLQSINQGMTYEFVVDPVQQPLQPEDQPVSAVKEASTLQLARSFIPASSVVTLQVDEEGGLYMDKLQSGSSQSQAGYRRRCTNLGFEKDISRFCTSIPKQSIFSFTEDDISVSTTSFSDQYFTDVNMGVSINKETSEGFRFFAPLWLKDRVPSYFAIFRKDVANGDQDLLKDSSLVKLVDIKNTELGKYLGDLSSNENFKKPPLEVSIDKGYSVKWNGVSLETGYWVSHTEFIGLDVQSGLSDFEFNQVLSGGFSRGLIVNPQFLNIEFLFNDPDAKVYNAYQYFGMYCDDIELSKFIPNIESTSQVFSQNFTRAASSSDFNDSTISNPDGVRMVVDLNEDPDRRFSVNSPSSVLLSGIPVQSRYIVSIAPPPSIGQRSLVLSFTSDADVTPLLLGGKLVRMEDSDGNFSSYVTVSSSSYDPISKNVTVRFEENDTFSSQQIQFFINIFDVDPDPSSLTYGRISFDSPDPSKARCIVISKQDSEGNDIESWISAAVDPNSNVSDSLVLFNPSTSGYMIVLAEDIRISQDYIKVFFNVIETDGGFYQGNDVFINVSEYDIDGAIPGPKTIASTSRKFLLKSKDDAYSVKSFGFSNYKNQVVGLFSLDSKTFNLGSIVGTSAENSIPVVEDTNPFVGLEVEFPSFLDVSLSYGDRITVEQRIGQSTRRWSVVRAESAGPSVSRTPGSITEVQIVTGSIVTDDSHTSIEIEQGQYFPVMYDRYFLTGSTTLGDIEATFVSAEALDNGNYRIVFSDRNIDQSYGSIRVEQLDTQITYFDYIDQSSLPTILASSFQRFVDCPMRSATSNERFYLYSEGDSEGLAVTIYSSYGLISRSTLNRSFLNPTSVRVDGEFIRSDYYRYDIDSHSSFSVYSILDEYAESIQEDTKILSKSGTPSTAVEWNNDSYSIPDIKSIVQESEERSLIRFDGTRSPSILNNRLQLIERNLVSLSLLSFYDLIDLDFFEEIPVRAGINESVLVAAYTNEQSLFSQTVKDVTSIRKQDPFTGTKTLSLSVDIVENMYSGWANWMPEPQKTVFGFSELRGAGTVDATEFPQSWNPGYGFRIEYMDKNGTWMDYPVSLPTTYVVPTRVSNTGIYLTFKTPSLQGFSLDVGSPAPISEIDGVFFYYVYDLSNTNLSNDNQVRLFSEMKDFVSYCFKTVGSNNIDPSSQKARYLASFTLTIDDEHRDYRYVTTFIDGTYVVKEETTGGYDPNRGVSGVTTQVSVRNFITSVLSADNKIKLSAGRWKKSAATNVISNPYLINVDPLLLPYDTFVNGTQDGSSPQAFPLDWYLISGWPTFEQTIKGNYQYLGKRIDVNELSSPEYDYFTDYFTVGAGDEVAINGQERSKKFLWTNIERNSNGYSCMFKGLPISFSSQKVNIEGAKFAAVLQVERDLTVPSKISLIYNQTWNAMTLLVQININSYFIDGSITIEQLYKIKTNEVRTDGETIDGPMTLFGSDLLLFNEVPRAYNTEEVVITNQTNDSFENYYEFNQFTYEKIVGIQYDYSFKDIELYGVRYIPDCDYIIEANVFSGSTEQKRLFMVIPRGRVRGVFDPVQGVTRTFIDGLYNDGFFAVLADVDGSPFTTYIKFSSENNVKIGSIATSTTLDSASVSVIGKTPVYRDIVDGISASSIMKRISNRDFDDILVSKNSEISTSGVVLSYLKPPVLRPEKVKIGLLDEFGNVTVQTINNTSNIFRVDGSFEPSYKNIIEYASSEDASITKQTLNSFKGYNTRIIGLNDINLWYKRVSDQGVDTGSININGSVVSVPYAIGRKTLSPLVNTWGDGFYSKAEDQFIDLPVSGTAYPMDGKFFFSSRVMSVPTFFRTSEYSASRIIDGTDTQNASIKYLVTQNRLTMYIELDRIISDYLFNAGVFSFFSSISESLPETVSPYTISREYIEKNLLHRYYVNSIDVYSRPSTTTQVVQVPEGADGSGFVQIDTIGIQQRSFFEFSIPVDGSKDISLAFNIKRT